MVKNRWRNLLKEWNNLLLSFVNEWLVPLKIKVKSLTEFKKISEKSLLENQKYNKDILRKYSSKLTEELNMQDDDIDVDSDEDSEDIKDKYIIYFVGKLLKTIDYNLIYKQFNKEAFYYIQKTTNSKNKIKVK